MERLILLRHGKAEPDSASGEDFDRRLSSRGARESAEMGAHLADMGFRPDLALISPAARTRETWEAMQASFPDAQVRPCDELYHAEADVIRRTAEQADGEARTVMVVGHNPGLQELALSLLAEGASPPGLIAKATRAFPPGAAAVFLIDHGGRAHYDGLFFPERQH
jgi:phosphohistidine phosphatase